MACKRFSMFMVVAVFSLGAFFGEGCSSDVSVAERNKQAVKAVSLEKLVSDAKTQEMEAQIDEHGRLYDEVEHPMDEPPVEGVQGQ